MIEKKPFLFDTHNFDDSVQAQADIVDEYIPPVPTYSEHELKAAMESAREEAFRKGRQEGFRESEEGFSSKIYETCQTLGGDIKNLLMEEDARNDLFQSQTYDLVKTSIEAALPGLMKRGDFNACLELLSQTIKSYKPNGEMSLTVSEQYIEPLKNYFEKNLGELHPRINFIIAEETPQESDLCQTTLSWKEGGVVRDPEALKENILKVLEQALAEKALRPQNKTETKVGAKKGKKAGMDDE